MSRQIFVAFLGNPSSVSRPGTYEQRDRERERERERETNMTTLIDEILYQGNALSGDYISPSVRL